jgi:hypothetical protein
MKVFLWASIALALSMGTATAAEPFDGSQPMSCKPLKGHDCLPGEDSCKPLKPESGKDQNAELGIDVAKLAIHSPFRTSVLPIQHATQNRESLVLQGADLQFAWSTVVNRTTGAMTLTIADRKGAYVVFGQCRIVPRK